MRMCSYPACRANGTHSWRLVPLCERHYDKIRFETIKYYSQRIKESEREHYNKIKGEIK